MSETHGTIWWSELMTRDVKKARAYYAKVAGWKFTKMKMPDGSDYHMGNVGGKPVAGLMDITGMKGMGRMPPDWFTYVAVDNVDKAVKATEKAGGKIVRPPWDVPGTGRIALVIDPSGAAVGLMTPAATR